jgi:hypothetical protein
MESSTGLQVKYRLPEVQVFNNFNVKLKQVFLGNIILLCWSISSNLNHYQNEYCWIMGHITTIVRVSECDYEYTFEQDILLKCVCVCVCVCGVGGGKEGHETILGLYKYMPHRCTWIFEQWLLLIHFVVSHMTGPWPHPNWVIHRMWSSASSFNLQYPVH